MSSKNKEEAAARMEESIGGVARSAERMRKLLSLVPVNSDIIVREASILSLWLSRYNIAASDFRILTSAPVEDIEGILDEFKPYLDTLKDAEERKGGQGNDRFNLN